MNSDYEYRFGEGEDYRTDSVLLSDNECGIPHESSDEYQPSILASVPDVSTDSQQSPVRFMTSHYARANTTTTARKDTDCSRIMTGRADSTIVVESPKTGQLDNHVVCRTDNEMSPEDREKNHFGASLRSDVDETQSITKHSVLCEGREDVGWSELSSARAVQQSSDDDSSSCDDDDALTWTDDEEPELRDLMADSSTEINESNCSDDYEKDGEDEECDGQPQETHKANHFIVDENGTFEEVCLSSSTYYFQCSGKDDSRGLFLFHLQ